MNPKLIHVEVKARRRERRHITALVNAAVAILNREQPMTIRQLFYRLVSAGAVPNDQGHYQLVSRVMTKARDDERIPFEYIVDRSRPTYKPNVWDDAAGYAESVSKSYRMNYWATQAQLRRTVDGKRRDYRFD